MNSLPTKKIFTDTNSAVAQVAYAYSEVIPVYPITPATSMAEIVQKKSFLQDKNILNSIPKTVMMQSEAGASATLHGALRAGRLATSFTASQGLLLMYPEMCKIAGERLPGVLHVASRSLAFGALSIFGDHSDVMSVRSAGWVMLCSSNSQEAQDFAALSHIISLQLQLPVLHFFEGFRISHHVSMIEPIHNTVLQTLLPQEEIDMHRKRALRSYDPTIVVGAQNPDSYFEGREASNEAYEQVSQTFTNTAKLFSQLTGRNYAPCSYTGPQDAQLVIVSMGSSKNVMRETMKTYSFDIPVGHLHISLFQPFPKKEFLELLPKTTKQIIVLDQTKEQSGVGEPLCLAVTASVQEVQQHKKYNPISIRQARYGLGGKQFTPEDFSAMIRAHLASPSNSNALVVGVSTSPSHAQPINTASTQHAYNAISDEEDEENKETIVHIIGYGSDGSVSGAKALSTSLFEKNYYVQAQAVYDSKQSSSITLSQIRFKNSNSQQAYDNYEKHYISKQVHILAISQEQFLTLDEFTHWLTSCSTGASVLVSFSQDAKEFQSYLTQKQQEIAIEKQLVFYCINTKAIHQQAGGEHNGWLFEHAVLQQIIADETLCEELSLHRCEEKFSKNVVDKNMQQIQLVKEHTTKTGPFTHCIPTKAKTKYHTSKITEEKTKQLLNNSFDGSMSSPLVGKTRLIPPSQLPVWNNETCIACGLCASVCPHGALRAVKIKATSSTSFATKKISTPQTQEQYRIQIYPEYCTGCGLCEQVCPVKNKAIKLEAFSDVYAYQEQEHAKAIEALSDDEKITPPQDELVATIAQQKPYLVGPDSCPGCAQTTALKLLTQLFGKQLVIVNATGCSSIYATTFPQMSYVKDNNNFGPSWANSLFEDAAEYGLGFHIGTTQRRDLAKKLLTEKICEFEKIYEGVRVQELQTFIRILKEKISSWDDANPKAFIRTKQLIDLASTQGVQEHITTDVRTALKDSVPIISWIVGGDGWAYDIGFGGLDHVVASGKNVNILILDNESYSNTGGQVSKASPLRANIPLSFGGKKQNKKPLAKILSMYDNVYVATINPLAKPQQTLKVLKEAAEFDGPSVVFSYIPCKAQGIRTQDSRTQALIASNSGYWPLYKSHPQKGVQEANQGPKTPVEELFSSEKRFSLIKK